MDFEKEFNRLVQLMYQRVSEDLRNGDISDDEADSLNRMIEDKTGVYNNQEDSGEYWYNSKCTIGQEYWSSSGASC